MHGQLAAPSPKGLGVDDINRIACTLAVLHDPILVQASSLRDADLEAGAIRDRLQCPSNEIGDVVPVKASTVLYQEARGVSIWGKLIVFVDHEDGKLLLVLRGQAIVLQA